VSPQANVRRMPSWNEPPRTPQELVERAGVRRVTDREARSVYGLAAPPTKKLDGLMFPYPDPNQPGEPMVWCRVRRDALSVRRGTYPLL
jgi:hypothetical protein